MIPKYIPFIFNHKNAKYNSFNIYLIISKDGKNPKNPQNVKLGKKLPKQEIHIKRIFRSLKYKILRASPTAVAK